SGTFQRAEAGLSRGAVAKSSRLYQSGNLRLPNRWAGKLAGQAQVIGDLLELSCAIDTSDGGRSLGQKRFASFQFVRVIEADAGLTRDARGQGQLIVEPGRGTISNLGLDDDE